MRLGVYTSREGLLTLAGKQAEGSLNSNRMDVHKQRLDWGSGWAQSGHSC